MMMMMQNTIQNHLSEPMHVCKYWHLGFYLCFFQILLESHEIQCDHTSDELISITCIVFTKLIITCILYFINRFCLIFAGMMIEVRTIRSMTTRMRNTSSMTTMIAWGNMRVIWSWTNSTRMVPSLGCMLTRRTGKHPSPSRMSKVTSVLEPLCARRGSVNTREITNSAKLELLANDAFVFIAAFLSHLDIINVMYLFLTCPLTM